MWTGSWFQQFLSGGLYLELPRTAFRAVLGAPVFGLDERFQPLAASRSEMAACSRIVDAGGELAGAVRRPPGVRRSASSASWLWECRRTTLRP